MGIAERKVRGAVQWHVGTAKRAAGREVSRDRRADTAHVAGNGPSPSQLAVASELSGLVGEALGRLPGEHREVLMLVREEGLSLRKAAERMGRSHEATRKLHQRAMFQFTEIFGRLRGRDDE